MVFGYTIRGKKNTREEEEKKRDGFPTCLCLSFARLTEAGRSVDAAAADVQEMQRNECCAVVARVYPLFHSRCADCNVKGQLLQFFWMNR